MENRIKLEDAAFDVIPGGNGGIRIKELLPGDIAGVRTRYVSVGEGWTYEGNSFDEHRHILFFTGGSGNAASGGHTFAVTGMAVFVPCFRADFTVTAFSVVEFLEISYKADVKDNNLSGLQQSTYFMEYSKCPTYREAIKSEKTINRTIIDVDVMPRFCMGSVETYGRDEVGAHSHPMIEQLFFGLPGNSCIVEADSEAVPFGEYTLLHIPRGSLHGVKVEEGHRLHYLWLDFFENNDMSYIRNSHIIEDK